MRQLSEQLFMLFEDLFGSPLQVFSLDVLNDPAVCSALFGTNKFPHRLLLFRRQTLDLLDDFGSAHALNI